VGLYDLAHLLCLLFSEGVGVLLGLLDEVRLGLGEAGECGGGRGGEGHGEHSEG
jgi:hypothetical protein